MIGFTQPRYQIKSHEFPLLLSYDTCSTISIGDIQKQKRSSFQKSPCTLYNADKNHEESDYKEQVLVQRRAAMETAISVLYLSNIVSYHAGLKRGLIPL